MGKIGKWEKTGKDFWFNEGGTALEVMKSKKGGYVVVAYDINPIRNPIVLRREETKKEAQKKAIKYMRANPNG